MHDVMGIGPRRRPVAVREGAPTVASYEREADCRWDDRCSPSDVERLGPGPTTSRVNDASHATRRATAAVTGPLRSKRAAPDPPRNGIQVHAQDHVWSLARPRCAAAEI